MTDYHHYLLSKQYSSTTARTYQREVELFTAWSKKQGYATEQMNYAECLRYIDYLNQSGISKKSVNHRVGSLKSYFNYVIQKGVREENPLEDVIVKGAIRKVHHQLLELEELEDLYYSYPTETIQDPYRKLLAQRNKVIAGVIVYQGVTTTDLRQLQTEHLQLDKGKLYVPSTKRSNARTLELKPQQMMNMMIYLKEVRPELQEQIKNYSRALFPLNHNRYEVMTQAAVKVMRKYNQQVKDIKQLRASVITNWLKQYSLRKVQYMAGHRYISSTEAYLQDDLENLQEVIKLNHPIQ